MKRGLSILLALFLIFGVSYAQSEAVNASPISAWPLQAHTDNPNVDVRISEMKVSGKALIVDLILTNKTNKTINTSTVNKEYCSGYENETMAVTTSGNVVKVPELLISVGDKSSQQKFALPPHVPVKMKVEIRGISNINEIAYLLICMRDFNPDVSIYGIGTISLSKE